ncbi:MAG: TetR/AcrR family transcriptional regulator [Clostridiales bacterium]|nr:TetR/AcrR family transcriptional regulator [Clostridiales bacterium]
MKKNNKSSLISDEMSDRIIEKTAQLVKESGTQKITVSKILKELDISNRVFYNRFNNIDEVLQTVYINSIMQMRKIVQKEIPADVDFFEYATQLAIKCLTDTYELLKQFSHYTFEHYSLSEQNRIWWTEHIKKLFLYAMDNNLIRKDIDYEALSYFIWCVCRGLNTDAVTRNFSRDEAIRYLKAGFGCFMDGLKLH